jgi:pseudouridine-5'-monophosphatase
MMKAVIFDLDGVLSDTEGIYEEVVVEIMKKFDINVPVCEVRSIRGLTSILVWEYIYERYSPPVTPEELLQIEHGYMDKLMESGHVPNIPSAFKLMKNVKDRGFKTAVATSNFGYRATMVLKQCEAESLVDVLVSCEDVEKVKPAPDTHILTAERLGEKPGDCVVIEDSPIGVKAAKTAGMKVVLYDPEKLFDNGDCDVDMILHSLDGVTWETLGECFV